MIECEGFGMPEWTKKNFDELRDVSPRDVPIQWRFARQALRSPELGVSRFTYEPGARMPWGHRHRVQQEVYVGPLAPLGCGRREKHPALVRKASRPLPTQR